MGYLIIGDEENSACEVFNVQAQEPEFLLRVYIKKKKKAGMVTKQALGRPACRVANVLGEFQTSERSCIKQVGKQTKPEKQKENKTDSSEKQQVEL